MYGYYTNIDNVLIILKYIKFKIGSAERKFAMPCVW